MSKLSLKLKKVGIAKNKPDSDFDRVQLDIGTKIEMEHFKDKEAAKEIAKDHLVEDPDYYKKLSRIEARKSVMLAKSKQLPVGTIKKYGASFYKKTVNKGWVRMPTGEGRVAYGKQGAKGKVGVKKEKTLEKPGDKIVYKGHKILRRDKDYAIFNPITGRGHAVKTKKAAFASVDATIDLLKEHKKVMQQSGKKLKPIKRTAKKVSNTQKTPTVSRVPSKTSGITQPEKTPYIRIGKKQTIFKETNMKVIKYVSKIMNIKIMNDSGKQSYIDRMKEAVEHGDEKKLKIIFDQIDDWIKRDKEFKRKIS